MGRKAFFTEQEIFEAADTLAAQGQEVTAQSLFKVMGGGSYTTVYKHLEAWRQSRPALVNPVVAMDLPEPVQTAFVAAWKVAASEAAREVSAIRDKAAEDVRATNKQLHEALEQMARLEAEADAAADEIEFLKALNSELEATAKKVENDNAGLTAKAEQLEHQVAHLANVEAAKDAAVKEAAQLSGQLEQLNKQNADLLSLLAQRDKQK